jgi:chemotaxis signal transduction protein
LNEVRLALDARRVIEVIGKAPWVPIPGAPRHLPGVVAWKGRAIAVVDLGVMLGVSAALSPDEPPPRTVVAQTHAGTLALPVDSVREAEEVGEYRLEPVEISFERFVSGQVDIHGNSVSVLDLQAIVAALTNSAGASP